MPCETTRGSFRTNRRNKSLVVKCLTRGEVPKSMYERVSITHSTHYLEKIVMMLDEGMTRRLERMAFAAEMGSTTITASQDVAAIPVGSLKVGPFRKGANYTIPLWQANILREFNLVEAGEGGPVSCSEIQKQVAKESTMQKLSEFHKNFYFNARCEESILHSLISTGQKPKDMGRRFTSYLYDLVQMRLSKLLKLATGAPSKATRRDLPEEEQVLLDSLSTLIA